MIPSQFEELVTWIEERWPTTKNFANWSKVAYDFVAIPLEAGMDAAHNFYNSGAKTAPTISELKAEAARIAAYKNMSDPQATNCEALGGHGAWAIEDRPDGVTREAMCVVCGVIRIGPRESILTKGEIESGLRPRRDADIRQAQMDLDERIAP